MSNQNKILSLRKMSRVGAGHAAAAAIAAAARSTQRALDTNITETVTEFLQQQMETMPDVPEPYLKNGLEYVVNGEYITPQQIVINQRNAGGEFILIEELPNNSGINNQNYFIDPNYEQLQNISVNNVIDTQFKYFKFPPTVTVTPITRIPTEVIDLEINDDLKAYQETVLDALAGFAAAQEPAQEGGGSTAGTGTGFAIINVVDTIFLSYHPIMAAFNYSNPALFTNELARFGFNWPINKFLGESESSLQKVLVGVAAGLSVALVAAAAVVAAPIFGLAVIATTVVAAPVVGGSLVGLLANGGLKADKNYVTISYQVSGDYKDGQDENGSPYALRALLVRGTSDSALTGKDLFNKAKQADKDKNFKQVATGLKTVTGVDENGEDIEVTFGFIQIQAPTNKYEDDYYLIIELGKGGDAKDFVGIDGTRQTIGPITTVKVKDKDNGDFIDFELKNKNNSQPDFEYNFLLPKSLG